MPSLLCYWHVPITQALHWYVYCCMIDVSQSRTPSPPSGGKNIPVKVSIPVPLHLNKGSCTSPKHASIRNKMLAHTMFHFLSALKPTILLEYDTGTFSRGRGKTNYRKNDSPKNLLSPYGRTLWVPGYSFSQILDITRYIVSLTCLKAFPWKVDMAHSRSL